MNSEKQSTNLQMTLREVNRVGVGQKNVPKLRFKGYEDAWEQRKLSEVCERVVRKNKNYESDLPLTIASQFGLIDQRDFFGKIVAAKDMSNYYLLKKGEFAYNKSYSKGFDFGSIKRLNNYELGCLSTLYICFKIASNRVESDYLEVYFDTLNWYKDIMSICAEGARNHGLLNVDTKAFFEEVNVDIPREILEQKNIASSLEKVEKLITLHQRKYDALKEMKKTLLSKMFPKNGEVVPEIRFKGFTDAWEQRKFGDVGTVAMCKRIFKEETSENGEVPFYKIGTFGGEPDAYISREVYKKYKTMYPYPKKGDILISASGSIGRTVEYTGKDEYFQDSNIIWLQHNKNIDNSFLKVLYSVVQWSCEGSTIKRLYNDNFLKTKIVIPNKKEQMLIGECFGRLDNLITLHQRKLDELKNVKKTLLQQMFV